jgi:hypothetical protein
MRACKALGEPIVTFSPHHKIIAKYPGVHKNLSNITTHHPRRFPQVWKGAPNMLLSSSRHIAAFIDGEVHDWSVNNALRANTIFIREVDKEAFTNWLES